MVTLQTLMVVPPSLARKEKHFTELLRAKTMIFTELIAICYYARICTTFLECLPTGAGTFNCFK